MVSIYFKDYPLFNEVGKSFNHTMVFNCFNGFNDVDWLFRNTWNDEQINVAPQLSFPQFR